MGLPDTSPVPKKDSMGMDYIPVYEGDGPNDGKTTKISLDRVQRSGVRPKRSSPRFGAYRCAASVRLRSMRAGRPS